MVGLVNIGLLDIFAPQGSEPRSGLTQPQTERKTSEQSSRAVQPLPFSVTLGKTKEIQAEAQRIRESFEEGYNYQTKKIKKLEPLITGLLQLNDFISHYWNYFTHEEKMRLLTQVNYLEQVSNHKYSTNFVNLFRVIFSQNFLSTIKLIFRYNNNWRIFTQFNNVNQRVADLIIDLNKKDGEKAQILVQFKNGDKVSSEMSFDEILEPIRHHVIEAKISEDELFELFEEARNEVWQEWKEKKKV